MQPVTIKLHKFGLLIELKINQKSSSVSKYSSVQIFVETFMQYTPSLYELAICYNLRLFKANVNLHAG